MKIIIKEIIRKDNNVVVVKFADGNHATMNTKWQGALVDYLEKEVGVGGSVDVEITQKGDYTNITNVNMESGVKGDVEVEKPKSFSDDRSNSIIAQCMVKAVFSQPCNFANDFKGIEQAVAMYKRALEMLNE